MAILRNRVNDQFNAGRDPLPSAPRMGRGPRLAARKSLISASFRGKSRVQQHQIVYQSLKGQMGGVLHALALQTGVPDGPGVHEG